MLNNVYMKCLILSIISVLIYHIINGNKNNSINNKYKENNYNIHIIIFVLSFIFCFLVNIYCNKEIDSITELATTTKLNINSNECPF